jgi:hypothetical protein
VTVDGDISPSITADQNDWAPTGLATATVIRVTTDAERTVTGLTGGTDGRIIIVRNVGSNPLVLSDENAASAAANRFQIGARSPSSRYSVRTVSTTATLTAADQIVLADASGGAFSVNLPAVAAVVAGTTFTIKKIDASAYTVTIEANGTEEIDGELQQVIAFQFTSITVVSDGVTWHVV